MKWLDSNVFVTGSTGFVGSWLTRELLKQKANPILLVRDGVPAMWQFDKTCTIIRGDSRDQPLIERILNEHSIDVIIHLACQSNVTYANQFAGNTFSSNIMGTVSILEAARKVKPGAHIVIMSSDKAYGASDELPYLEHTPLLGRNPYDCSKSCQDMIAQSYQLTQDLRVAIPRCGNIYGGGDLTWNRLIPNTIRRLVRGNTPVIYGAGSETRDLFYVEDTVRALMLLVEKDATGPYNFSTGEELTVKSVIETICRLMGKPVHYETLMMLKGEISYQVLDSSKARAELGWSPCFTLEDGLAKTIEWYRSYLA